MSRLKLILPVFLAALMLSGCGSDKKDGNRLRIDDRNRNNNGNNGYTGGNGNPGPNGSQTFAVTGYNAQTVTGFISANSPQRLDGNLVGIDLYIDRSESSTPYLVIRVWDEYGQRNSLPFQGAFMFMRDESQGSQMDIRFEDDAGTVYLTGDDVGGMFQGRVWFENNFHSDPQSPSEGYLGNVQIPICHLDDRC